MNIDQALANARTRLAIGWPLLVLALALYAPADGVTRIVLLAVGAALAAGKLPAAFPAGKAGPSSPKSRKTSSIPEQSRGGEPS